MVDCKQVKRASHTNIALSFQFTMDLVFMAVRNLYRIMPMQLSAAGHVLCMCVHAANKIETPCLKVDPMKICKI